MAITTYLVPEQLSSTSGLSRVSEAPHFYASTPAHNQQWTQASQGPQVDRRDQGVRQ